MVEENGVKKEIERLLFGKVKKNCEKAHTLKIYTQLSMIKSNLLFSESFLENWPN